MMRMKVLDTRTTKLLIEKSLSYLSQPPGTRVNGNIETAKIVDEGTKPQYSDTNINPFNIGNSRDAWSNGLNK